MKSHIAAALIAAAAFALPCSADEIVGSGNTKESPDAQKKAVAKTVISGTGQITEKPGSTKPAAAPPKQ